MRPPDAERRPLHKGAAQDRHRQDQVDEDRSLAPSAEDAKAALVTLHRFAMVHDCEDIGDLCDLVASAGAFDVSLDDDEELLIDVMDTGDAWCRDKAR